MKRIKVIDLLTKKARGEVMPEKIAFDRYIYIWLNGFVGYCRWDEEKQKYIRMSTDFELTDALNKYAQIIKEKKIPKKIDLYKSDDTTLEGLLATINVMFADTTKKINAIIDYLESKEKGDE